MRLVAQILVLVVGAANAQEPPPAQKAEAFLDIDRLEEEQCIDDTNKSPFELSLEVDLPIILTGVLIGTAPSYMDIDLRRDLSRLDAGSVNKMDRNVVDNWSGTADKASDVFLIATLALPGLLDLIDSLGSDEGMSGFGKDMVILLETAAVNCMLFNLSKFTVQRPRPYAYNPSLGIEQRNGENASLSFFSGHTSLAFSMATAYSYLYTKRHPDSPWVAPVWIGSHALAATTGVLRVKAGKHFWSDVLVGAAVGSLVGYAVPALHLAGDGDDNGRQFMLTPLYYDGGFGACATWVF